MYRCLSTVLEHGCLSSQSGRSRRGSLSISYAFVVASWSPCWRKMAVSTMPDIVEAPHLNGAINETLRLFPAVPLGVYRNTPADGFHVKDTFVPTLSCQATRRTGCRIVSWQEVSTAKRLAYRFPSCNTIFWRVVWVMGAWRTVIHGARNQGVSHFFDIWAYV